MIDPWGRFWDASPMPPACARGGRLPKARRGSGSAMAWSSGRLSGSCLPRIGLTVAAVQVRVEECLGRPISQDSVRSCLSTDVHGQEPRFERTAPGMYRLAGDV